MNNIREFHQITKFSLGCDYSVHEHCIVYLQSRDAIHTDLNCILDVLGNFTSPCTTTFQSQAQLDTLTGQYLHPCFHLLAVYFAFDFSL